MNNEEEGPFEGQETDLINISISSTLGFWNHRFRCLKLLPHKKEPLEKGWTTTKNYPFNSQEIENWVRDGGNYAITCPNGDCCFVDADTKEIQTILDEKLPTFWYSTGREGHRQYVYGINDPPIKNIPLRDGAYVKGQNGYAVGPGSIHPNGTMYGLSKSEYPIRTVTKGELLEVLKPFMVRTTENKERPKVKREGIAWLSIADLIDLSKFKHFGNQYQGPHPIHGSETGVNLSVDLSKNLWHCFRHDSGGSILEWIAVSECIIDCADAVPGVLRGDKFWKVLEVANRRYGLKSEVAAKMLKGELKHDTNR